MLRNSLPFFGGFEMESKYTPGPWEIIENGISMYGPNALSIAEDGDSLVAIIAESTFARANAHLIADAGTVAHETGMTPRQLAESHARLLAALETIEARLTRAARAFFIGDKVSKLREALDGWIDDVESARIAISQAKGL
jgi:hypothetical protein